MSGEAVVLPAQILGHRLVAVSSRDRARAEFFADLCGVEAVADTHSQVLADPNVEAVYIPQVPALHAELTLAAVVAGKHVLCEKPLCIDAGEAARVWNATAAAASATPAAPAAPAVPAVSTTPAFPTASGGIVVREALHYLHHPLWRRIAALLTPRAGDGSCPPDVAPLGHITAVDLQLTMRPPTDGDPRWSAELGGGVLTDLGCYGLQVQHLVSRLARAGSGCGNSAAAGASEGTGTAADADAPAVVSAVATMRGAVDGRIRVELRHPSGARGTVFASMESDRTRHRLVVVGTRGRLVVEGFLLPHLGGSMRLDGPAAPIEQGPALFAGPSTYTCQLDDFARRIRTAATDDPTAPGDPSPPALCWSLDDSVAVARLVDSVRAAAGLLRYAD